MTCTSCPQACESPTVAPAASVAVAVDAYGRPVSSCTGSASMSARHRTVLPWPFARTPTTPPPSRWTSKPHSPSRSAQAAEVRDSWPLSSGWACRSR